MFFSQRSTPRNPLVGFILNIVTVCLLALGPLGSVSATSLTEYCDLKTLFAAEVFAGRDDMTKNEVLDGLTADWRASGRLLPWYYVVDMERVVNDVYRKYSNGVYRLKNSDDLLKDTKEYCNYYGY
jgi:hypothetical protein